MVEITSLRWLIVKAALFVLLGTMAAILILASSARLSTAVLLAVCIWAFARAYYFFFYVLGHYVDPKFNFSGMLAAFRWLMSRRSKSREVVESVP